MFVKPAEGRIVRDPVHLTPLPTDGREVPETQYWRQRVIQGDAIECEPPAPAAEPPQAEPPAADQPAPAAEPQE